MENRWGQARRMALPEGVSGFSHSHELGLICPRVRRWRKGATERTNAMVPGKRQNQAIIVWEILDDDELVLG